ncbi:hypothetical protein TIFTF001_050073 [Ficus carica]|uniref:Uncharacterized protein n=1 Tax=Ficus carica TaxID=3494 RepID=A0AA88CWZ6_FICCA|nr:hypothetical protein TIFTF001_050073 [Ficus carica]
MGNPGNRERLHIRIAGIPDVLGEFGRIVWARIDEGRCLILELTSLLYDATWTVKDEV